MSQSHPCSSLTKCLDKRLHGYYQSQGRFDYITNDGHGLFYDEITNQAFDSETVEEELNGDVEECGFLAFDLNFPIDSTTINRDRFIFDSLRRFLQQHRSQRCLQIQTVPILSSPITSTHSQNVSREPKAKTNHSQYSRLLHHEVNVHSNNSAIRPVISITHSPVSIRQNVSIQCTSLVKCIDRELQTIYTRKGLEYLNEDGIGKFEAFCNINEYEDENIADELEDIHQCMLLDFDPEFPFDGNQNDRNQQIFDVLSRLHQYHINGHPVDEPNDDRKYEDEYSGNFTENQPKCIHPQTSAINKICNGMRLYFKDHHIKYNGMISRFCSDRGIDHHSEMQSVRDELITVLLPTFPFTMQTQNITIQQKGEFIWNLIQSFCADYVHPGKLPQILHTVVFLRRLFDSVSNVDFMRSRNRYQSQCPSMWRRDMAIDHGFVFALAVGDKYGFPFLQYLVDDYLCTKANRRRFPNGLSVKDWAADHNRYLKAMKDYNIQIDLEWMETFNDPDRRNSGQNQIRNEMQRVNGTAYDIMVHAVRSWSKRCVQDWKTTQYRIDDSEERVMETFGAYVEWVNNSGKFTWEQTVCPSQIDICFVFDKKKIVNKGL